MGDTMKIRGHGCVISGKEGRTPPLDYITVSETEGKALIAQGIAVEVNGEADAPAPATEPTKPAEKPTKAPKAAKSAPQPEKAPETPTEPEKAPEGGDGGDERANTIAEALDLVDGEPTVEAVADITGLADVTAEEIVAAVAAKESAE